MIVRGKTYSEAVKWVGVIALAAEREQGGCLAFLWPHQCLFISADEILGKRHSLL